MSLNPFPFRLARLLTLRERFESDAAVAFAAARARAEALRQTEAELEARRVVVRDGLMPATGGTDTVGSSRLRTLLLEELEARALTVACAIAAAESECEERQRELNIRLRERRVLERLRDRQRIAAQAESSRLDRVAMDEVALRHTERNTRPEREN